MTDRPAAFLVLFMLLLSFICPSAALAISEEEMAYLKMYFKDEELEVVSSTRSLKSISRVAENMTVITAADIELMNAHSLSDVLNTINGSQVQSAYAAPGFQNLINIQGSNSRHVTVFMDGIPMNSLASMIMDSGYVPVQQIKKIEIVKGPASSAWGSSLGGVINIITKEPPDSDKMGGTLSASYGERNTGDFRAEASGKKDWFGFYVSAGRLQTDGFRPVNDIAENNVYAKLSFNLSPDTKIIFTNFYAKTKRGDFQDLSIDEFDRDHIERLQSSLSLNTALSNELSFNVSLWASANDTKALWYAASTGDLFYNGFTRDREYGASARVTWTPGIHTVVIGSDYEDGTLKSDILDGSKKLTKWAVYVNDTISIGKLSVTPGLRHDHISINGNFTSPSLGITYELLKKTILRAYVAEGFSMPNLTASYGTNSWLIANPDLKVERVWSYQAGFETAALKYFWLKLTAFRHDISDGITTNNTGIQFINKNKIQRQGLETEIRTMPLYNTTLSAGMSYINTEDRLTGERLKDVPTNTYNISLNYDNTKTFRAVLQGNYIWWRSQDYFLGKYNAFIFDANIIKTLYQQKTNKLEAFVTAHNIFNGSQYWTNWYQNAPRWLEAGLRYKF